MAATSGESKLAIYVGNIPFHATAADLVGFFEQVSGRGSIRSCDIKTNANGTSKGYGFLEFTDEVGASQALSYGQNNVFRGRGLKVDFIKKTLNRKPKHGAVDLEIEKLNVGFLSQHDVMNVLWSCDDNTRFEIDFDSGKITLFMSKSGEKYKMEIAFSHIYLVEQRQRMLLLQLHYPPFVYKESLMSRLARFSLCNIFYYINDDAGSWVRSVDFTPLKSIGHSLAYCLELERGVKCDKIIQKLADFHLSSYPSPARFLSLIGGRHYALAQELVPILGLDAYPLDLDLLFKVNHLVQNNFISPSAVCPDFHQLLSTVSLSNAKYAFSLYSDTSYYNPHEVLSRFLKKHPRLRSLALNPELDEGLVQTNRICITPTKVYCMEPDIELSNRVTRHYSDHIENFLRVSFVEEDFNRVGTYSLTHDSDIPVRIKKVLNNGVLLGTKSFRFLAFSSSQLREASLWMFADTGSITADVIRRWMGNFLDIRNVAKCAARMGQCFSSSTHTLDVSKAEVDEIPDVERYVDGINYCFSDGAGKMSQAFAKKVALKCAGIRKIGKIPSAFQIRYGGYKGVVAVDPGSPYKLSLRPSMCKFPSTYTGLDVLSWTKYIPCFLNRQVITLLSTLGVRDDVFMQLQNDVIQQLDRMFQNPALAIELVQAASIGECQRFIVDMLSAGYHPSTEPYLKSLLLVFRASQLIMLRTKSRILVQKGRCLMGCLDETGSLNYGEIFVQVSSIHSASSTSILDEGLKDFQGDRGVSGSDTACVVVGNVVVAKNPCLHPGDVLVLRAVDIPQLRHMVDCVVFPQKGRRPHPNECSGSDLDGDLYFVTWDTKLMPTSRHEPMDYTPQKPQELDHAVNLEDIYEFFLNYMKSDTLGAISNAHTVLADKSPDKARDEGCLQLARLFSVAVDFPKTGVPATIPTELIPKTYPDFMERENKVNYESENVIGKLYRSVKKVSQNENPLLPMEHEACKEYDKDILVSGFESHLDQATTLKNWYDHKLLSLMNRYEIEHEAEAITGLILKFPRYYKRRQGQLKEQLSLEVMSLQKEARSWLNAADELEEEAKASAWYVVTYHPKLVVPIEGTGSRTIYLYSFPWVVHDILLKIKRRKIASRRLNDLI